MACMESPLRTKSRPTCAKTDGVMVSCSQVSPITSADAKARDIAPLAASTAAVLDASAAEPAACASISRTTASEKSPPDSRFSDFDHGQRISRSARPGARCSG